MTSVPYTPRVAKPNGWWGMVLFVATEATLFGTLIGSYYDLRFRTQPWPPAGVPDPKLVLPLILLGVLVATSIPVQLASVWGRARRVRSAQLALLLALAMHTFTPQDNAYGSIYFTMVGAHHAHVVVGILLEAWLVLRLFGGMTRYRAVGLQATAFYWHAVNVLAVAVTLVQLSPSL
jgi:cytochrome c oxidase subunit 3/cytochrome c oxidase subunit I+III